MTDVDLILALAVPMATIVATLLCAGLLGPDAPSAGVPPGAGVRRRQARAMVRWGDSIFLAVLLTLAAERVVFGRLGDDAVALAWMGLCGAAGGLLGRTALWEERHRRWR